MVVPSEEQVDAAFPMLKLEKHNMMSREQLKLALLNLNWGILAPTVGRASMTGAVPLTGRSRTQSSTGARNMTPEPTPAAVQGGEAA